MSQLARWHFFVLQIYLQGDIIMNYYKPNQQQMTKKEALTDALRRQTNEMRQAKTPAQRCEIQKRYTAEKLSIMKNYPTK